MLTRVARFIKRWVCRLNYKDAFRRSDSTLDTNPSTGAAKALLAEL